MPVRDQTAPQQPTKSRSGMFKWMISGHKHKYKQEKLNNAVLNNKNKQNLKQQPQQQQQQEVSGGQESQQHQQQQQQPPQQQQQQLQQSNGPLHITEPANNIYNHSNYVPNSNQHPVEQQQYQQQPQQQQHQQQNNADINQNVDNICDDAPNGLSSSLENDKPSPPPTSRPPPPPTHPPPPVPLQNHCLPHPPQQPLPPVPGQHEENIYQQERPLQAPGTCTLPRRGLVREEPNGRYRSPSNPPPASRQPPPYSRHQPPDPIRRNRGPYQPPPPPKVDSRDHRDQWDARGSRDLQERDHGGLHERTDAREYRETRERQSRDRESRDHWDRRECRDTYEPKERRESRNFHEILDSWEKREAKDHTNPPRDNRSSSLPRGNDDNWISKQNRWSSREPDSGFDSLNNPTMELGPRSLDSVSGHPVQMAIAVPGNVVEAPYSQSTEDLLNASRTSPDSITSATPSHSSTSSSPVQYPTIRPAKQPCINGASHHSPLSQSSPHSPPHELGSPHHHSTPIGQTRTHTPEEALLSDSVYPQHDNQPRYAEIPDIMETRRRDEEMNHRISRDMRDTRETRDISDSRKSREITRDSRELTRDSRELTRDSRELTREPRDLTSSKEQRDNRHINEMRSGQETRTTRGYRETSLTREYVRDSRTTVLEVREDRLNHEDTRVYRELSVDGDDEEEPDPRHGRPRGRRDARTYSCDRTDMPKEVRFSKDPSEELRVRDAPLHDRRDRDADGADDLQVTERRGSISHSRDKGQQDPRRGDGATSSSVSWMEWTQQLQAYVAWVNSQLRKRGRPLITDLRRDLQSGVVFSDLIEILSGERVAGISREGNTVHSMRENLERILQFMAAKRIRMTHITSKEVVEGNLKSIMRIILALAAHYKPQSVKATSTHQQESSSNSRVPTQPPATHDVGVGPDSPPTSAEKTPNLSANRRAIVAGGAPEDAGNVVGLRRHPSMNATPGPPRDSSPVYENLPRRTAPNRWAYDSLRPSHKFQWSAAQGHRSGPPSLPPKPPNLDESADEPLNTSFNASLSHSVNTSLNTSLDGDVEVSSPRHDSVGFRGATRPGALNFWNDHHARMESSATPPGPNPSTTTQENAADDPDNPFRYHTIHRMSGRRKLPQIPGASCPSTSRITTPREDPESPRGPGESPTDRGDDRSSSSGGTNDEGSREPEGRSQNSSPATSLIRGPTLDQWPREKKNQIDPWEQDDLKGVLRDLNSTRDQLLALQHLELDPNSRVGHSTRTQELVVETSTTSPVSKQEILHLSLARQALEAEKSELKRLLDQRENIITELRKQMHHRDKTIQVQRAQFEDAIRNLQNGKRPGNSGDNPFGRGKDGNGGGCGGTREELQLVRDAITALRSNFRGTDPNQHTLDTLEQAIAVLIERCGGLNGGGGAGGSSGGGSNGGGVGERSVSNGIIVGSNDKSTRLGDKRPQVNGAVEQLTKVIYFTERTVTPFMSTISKRLGDIRLRDFKSMFDRPGLFRFHFKSHDPEYGMVKEEIINDDDILPGVEGKIIAWVEEDND